MLWLRTPEKVYFKKGCTPVALDELGTVMGKKRAFIVTDAFLYKNGYTKPIEEKLDQMGIVIQLIFRCGTGSVACICQSGRKGHDGFRTGCDHRSRRRKRYGCCEDHVGAV